MKTPELAFRSVSVRQMPGFEDEGYQLDELEPCINIITGRNASGKTTTARALCLLLWPSDEHEWSTHQADVSGELVLEGDEWTLDVKHGQASYLQEGIRRDHFPAPAEQTRDRYNLALHELIQSDDEAFAERIIRESAGGYDLEAAAEHLGYSEGVKTRGITEYREYQESRKALQEVRREQNELKDDERRLDELTHKRRNAREADRRTELLELALALKRAEKELTACETALEEYPAGIEEASGEEYERIQSLNEGIDEAEARREAAMAEKESALQTIESLAVPAGGIEDADLERLSDQLAVIEDLRRRISQRQEELDGYRSEARQIVQALHPELSMDDWLQIDLDAVNRLDRFAESSADVRAKKRRMDVMEKWLAASEEDLDPEKFHAGASMLRAWLREIGSDSSSGVPLWLAIAAVVSTVIAGMLAHIFGMVGWLFLIVPGGLLVYGWRSESSAADGSRLKMRQVDYREMELEQPEDWTISSVKKLLTNLYEKYAEAKVDEERRQRWQALQEDRDEVEEQEQRVEQARTELEDRIGPVPFVDGDISLAHFLQKVRQFQQKTERIAGTETRIAELENQLSKSVDTINEGLRSFEHPEVSSVDEAKEVVRKIERDYKQWMEASRTLDDAREGIHTADQAIAEKTSERAAIYDKLSIEEGETRAVKQFMQQVEPYDEAKKKEFSARDRRNEAQAALKEHSLYTPEITAKSREELQNELERCRAEAERLEEINKEINRIETLVAKQQNTRDLERALAKRNRHLDALEALREDNLSSLVGRVLVETVREKTRYQNRPAVFRKADELFRRITSGRYQLLLDGSAGGSFEARDTQEDRSYALEDLSSGTKIQLLLAVRMAFVESQEQTVKFPLFVDEVLANSDDIRARAIIDALVEICEDGRQIFYFTAQSDEVQKWRQILEHRNIKYSIRSLSDTESISAAGHASDNGLSVNLVHAVTPPDGQSHASYGEQLDVPRFRPLVDPIEKIHLWYLVEDTSLLHACLANGINSWGPLKTYSEIGGEVPEFEEDQLEVIGRKADIVREVLTLYRRGRPKPVPPRELRKTEAVTDNFIEEVTELLDEVEGNPERLIQALKEGQVSGFRKTKRRELEAYFEERGYIDPDEVISEEEFEARIQAIVSGYPEIDRKKIERILERVLG